MKRKPIRSHLDERLLIIPDSRGRLQLPKELRGYPIYELSQVESGHILRGMKIMPEPKSSNLAPTPRWIPKDAAQFFFDQIKPKLITFLRSKIKTHSVACCLFGSYARGEATSESDFDIAILLPKQLNFKERSLICEQLDTLLEDEKRVLTKHKIFAEFSFVFINSDAKDVPPIYYSIAKDGILLYETNKLYSEFCKKIKLSGSKIKMKAVYIAGNKTWSWKT